jgi:hypothetical protein
MKKICLFVLLGVAAAGLFGQDIGLNQPPAKLGVDVLDAIRMRAAARAFVKKDLSAADLSAIVWAGNGSKGTPDAISSASKAGRTIPVSGDVDYINLYVLTPKGVYRYVPESNTLKQLTATDQRSQVTPESIANAPLMVLFTLDPTKLPSFVKPGTAGARELAIGTASYGAENLALVAAGLKLSSIVMYNLSATAAGAAQLAKDEVPLFIVQLGYTQ